MESTLLEATRRSTLSLVDCGTLIRNCAIRFSRVMAIKIGGCRLLCAGSYAITQGGREAQGVPGTHKKNPAGKLKPAGAKPPQRGGGTGVLAKSCGAPYKEVGAHFGAVYA